MSDTLVCSQGHRWSVDETAPTRGDASTCPVCGESVSESNHDGTGSTIDLVTPDHASHARAEPRSEETARSHARGRFTILRQHAEGGLGKVSVARDELLGREVALKEIRDTRAYSRHARERFIAEAEITSQLEHPGIVPIYTMEYDEMGVPFYAMRLIQGQTLGSAIRQYHESPGQNRLRDLLFSFEQICQSIAYAHSKGILHRDLKPDNVMLGSFGETLVLDWGLAKRFRDVQGPVELSSDGDPDAAVSRTTPTQGEGSSGNGGSDQRELTQMGQVLGTAAYMSPEQAEGHTGLVGPETDIYSLGTILYEILAGRPPYRGATAAEVVEQVLQGPPHPPSAIHARVPPALEAVCQRAMARQPAARYATATDLAEDIKRWLADEPVSAWTEPWPRRLQRWVSAHRMLVSTVVASLVVAAVCLGAATVWLTSANERERVARRNAQAARQLAQRNEAAAARASRRAERHFQMARDAVEEMLTSVGIDELENTPYMEEVRRGLLAKAVAFYQQFVRDESDDPEVRREAGRAYASLATLQAVLGEIDNSEVSYAKAIALLSEGANVATAGQRRHASQGDLARAHASRGLQRDRASNFEEAEVDYRAAISLYRQPVDSAEGDGAGYRNGYAETLSRLGNVHARFNEFDEAEQQFDAAHSVLASSTTPDPADPGLALAIARLDRLRGDLYFRWGRIAQANACQRDGYEATRHLLGQFPDRRDVRNSYASSLVAMATVQRAKADLSQADSHLATAQGVREALASDYPRFPDYRASVAAIYRDRADIFNQLGKFDAGRGAFEHALETLTDLIRVFPDIHTYRSELASTHYLFGALLQPTVLFEKAGEQLEFARDRYEELVRDFPNVPDYQVQLAETYTALGSHCDETGQIDAVAPNFDKARRLFETLTQKYEDQPRYRAALAATLSRLATTQARIGAFTEAAKNFDRADSLFADLWQNDPENLRAAEQLSASYHNHAMLYLRNAKLDEAERLFRQALNFNRELIQRAADNRQTRFDLANTAMFLGNTLRERNQFAEAETNLREARERFQKLAAEYPHIGRYASSYAASSHNLANVLASVNRPGEAEKAYRQSVEQLQNLVQKYPQTYQFQRDLGSSWMRLGTLLAQPGRFDEAEQAVLEAQRIYGRLLELIPQVSEYREQYASALHNHGGILLRSDRYADAEPKFRQSVELMKALVEKSPDVPQLQRDLANSLMLLALAIEKQQRYDEAVAPMEESRKRFADLCQLRPDNPEFRFQLAAANHNLGEIYRDQKKHPDAEQAFRTSREMLAALMSRFGPVPAIRRDLASTCQSLAATLTARQQSEEAAQIAKQAIDIWQGLTGQFADEVEYRAGGAVARYELAKAQLSEGKDDEARPLLEQAWQIQQELRAAGPHDQNAWAAILKTSRDLTQVMIRQQKHHEAMVLLEKVTGEIADSSAQHVDAACLYVAAATTWKSQPEPATEEVTTLMDRCLQRAVQHLDQAVDKGWKQREALEQHEDLQMLRNREDFRALLERLER